MIYQIITRLPSTSPETCICNPEVQICSRLLASQPLVGPDTKLNC